MWVADIDIGAHASFLLTLRDYFREIVKTSPCCSHPLETTKTKFEQIGKLFCPSYSLCCSGIL